MSLYTKPEKTKVVLDTNIVISALISKEGAPAKIFEKILLGEIESYTSNEILTEIEDVLNREEITKRTQSSDREFIFTNFKANSIIIEPKTKVRAVIEDPDDDKFLEVAIDAKAHYIISGDPHLTKLEKFKGIKIITPKQTMQVL